MSHMRFAGPEDVTAIEAVPIGERIGFATLDAMLAASRDRAGDDPALIWLPNGRADDPPETINFAALHRAVLRAANLFHSLGVRPDAAVSILLPNLPETHFALWGGSLAGVANPVNPLLRPEQIAAIMAAAGSRVLVTGGPGIAYDVLAKAQAVRELYPALETIVTVGGGGGPAGAIDFAYGCSDQPDDRLTSGRRIRGDDVSVYFHTGGTTGTPKLAQQTHWNQVFMAWTSGFVLGLTREDRILTGLPLFHANAAVATGLGAMYWGAASLLCGQQGYRDKAMLADFWQIAARHRATLFSCVPTILAALLETLPEARQETPLRFAMCGAAPMPVPLFEAFEARTGLRVLELYGMTEGAALSTANPRDGERRVGSIGLRLPYQGCRAGIVDDAGGLVRDCADGEPGHLLLSGPNLFPGYRQAERNRGIWAEPGWLDSGDLARRDGDGYFWLLGRAKDLIIRGGHNIDPAMIEEVLHRHPAVELAAAVGRPDPYAGEVPIAYVALSGAADASAEELRDYARSRVADPAAAPTEVVIVDAIPVTAVGKIFKPALRIDAARRALEAATAGLDTHVEVAIDERSGMGARVACTMAELSQVEQRLAQFAFAIDIEAKA